LCQNKIPRKFGFTESTDLSRPATASGGISAWAARLGTADSGLSGKVNPSVVRPQISAAFLHCPLLWLHPFIQGMGRRGLLTAALLLCFLAVCSGRGESNYSFSLFIGSAMFYRDVRRLYLEVLVLLNLGILAMSGSCKKKGTMCKEHMRCF